ncbi:MAG TPA: universal stress protein [Chloroflexota bacterium]|nr:universal stress protein [Chloroflexota bacterium]
MTYRSILVPLDGSTHAASAIPYARALAERSGGRLLLVRAELTDTYPGPVPVDPDIKLVREADAYLRHIAADLPEELVAETKVCHADPDDAIIAEVDAGDVDLVVMSTHGRSGLGRWIYGSVADEVIRRASVPILLIPVDCAESWQDEKVGPVLVPLDGSRLAEQAVKQASDLARVIGAPLLLVRIVEMFISLGTDPRTPDGEMSLTAEEQNYLESIAANLRAEGHAVSTRTAIGRPVARIAAIAMEDDVSAIALATHGRSGLSRLLMGSVATGVLQRASVPVLLVRPTASADATEETNTTTEP